MEEIPVAFVFHNAVVRGPSYHGVENHATIGEWPVWRGARGITEQMSVTGRVREVI